MKIHQKSGTQVAATDSDEGLQICTNTNTNTNENANMNTVSDTYTSKKRQTKGSH